MSAFFASMITGIPSVLAFAASSTSALIPSIPYW